jgi:hypothetical protein
MAGMTDLWAEFDRLHEALDVRPHRREVRRLWLQLREVERSLAGAFGRRHGWQLSERGFDCETLVRRQVSGPGILPHGVGRIMSPWDHPYWYRETIRPYRAAAVAAHPYGIDGERAEELMAWADRVGLVATLPDERSWWNPDRGNGGGTRLVVYTPKTGSPIPAAAWREIKMVKRYFDDLVNQPVWVAWRVETQEAQWRQTPMRVRGDIAAADLSNPDHLGTLEEARTRAAQLGQRSGIALVLDEHNGYSAPHFLRIANRINFFNEQVGIAEMVCFDDGRTEPALIMV